MDLANALLDSVSYTQKMCCLIQFA